MTGMKLREGDGGLSYVRQKVVYDYTGHFDRGGMDSDTSMSIA